MRHKFLYCSNCGGQIKHAEITGCHVVLECRSCKSRFEGIEIIDKERQQFEEEIIARVKEVENGK